MTLFSVFQVGLLEVVLRKQNRAIVRKCFKEKESFFLLSDWCEEKVTNSSCKLIENECLEKKWNSLACCLQRQWQMLPSLKNKNEWVFAFTLHVFSKGCDTFPKIFLKTVRAKSCKSTSLIWFTVQFELKHLVNLFHAMY